MTTALITVGLGGTASTLMLTVAALIAHDGGDPPHPGFTDLPPDGPAGHVGCHYEDTVEIVPANYMPPIGRRRIALLTDTQQMEAITA